MTDLVFLTPRELAKLLRRSERTLARWRREGRGPRFTKEGSRILYPRSEVEGWLSRSPRYSSTSEYGGGKPTSSQPKKNDSSPRADRLLCRQCGRRIKRSTSRTPRS
jgi:excisionase family DNA binding protein